MSSPRTKLLLSAVGLAVVCYTAYTVFPPSEISWSPTHKKQSEIPVGKTVAKSSSKLLFHPGLKPAGLHDDVTVVSSEPKGRLPHWDCVDLPSSPRPNTKICLYPVNKDVYVSAQLKRGQLFESGYVQAIGAMLKADPDLQLVDFGANIGVYTMFAAASGSQVLAVDMLPDNIRQIQNSLWVSRLEDQVTLVNNGLFSDHRELTANFISDNVGATHLNTSKIDFKKFGMPEDHKRSITVKTICIDDLIPLVKKKKVVMKIDIERAEAKALSCAHNFFTKIDVRLVFMEWLAKTPEDIKSLNEFFAKHGYKSSSNPSKVVPVNTNVPTVGGSNVYFIKTS